MLAVDKKYLNTAGVSLALIRKAGYMSMRAAIKEHPTPTPEYKRCVAFIRHPIERLRSCWNFGQSLSSWLNLGADRDYISQEDFIDAVLSGERNIHWDAQTSQHNPTECYRFEGISSVWPRIFGGVFPHENASKGDAFIMYRCGELERFYMNDLDAWENASGA